MTREFIEHKIEMSEDNLKWLQKSMHIVIDKSQYEQHIKHEQELISYLRQHPCMTEPVQTDPTNNPTTGSMNC